MNILMKLFILKPKKTSMKYSYKMSLNKKIRKVWRYQNCNEKPSIDEGQTIQCPKEKRQKDKQWSTTYYTEN